MKEQKVIITDSHIEINGWLERGWTVKEVVAGHVDTGSSFTQHGKFCFILEKLS